MRREIEVVDVPEDAPGPVSIRGYKCDEVKMHRAAGRSYMDRTQPVLLKLSGCEFRGYTAAMTQPYDPDFALAMREAARSVIRQLHCARIAYVAGDSVTFLLIDHGSAQSANLLDRDRLCSNASRMSAMLHFHLARHGKTPYVELPIFRAECWNLPMQAVVPSFAWQQQSHIQHFANDIKRANPDADVPAVVASHTLAAQRGACVKRQRGVSGWFIDEELPLFHLNWDYIGRYTT